MAAADAQHHGDAPEGRVSKGGQRHDWFPPFETHRYAVLDRVRWRWGLLEWRASSNHCAA